MSKAQAVSVVIPCRDSAETLGRVLEAIGAGLLEGDELFVVDDGSTDETPRIASSGGATVVPNDHAGGAAGARNAGAARSGNPILLFVDSDAVVRPGWRAALDHWLGEGRAEAVQAVYAEEAPGTSASTFYKNFYYHYTFTRRIRNRWLNGCGTFFFAVRASAFRAIGGFDEMVRGASIEDADISARLTASGARIRLVPEVEVLHLRTYRLAELLRYDWRMVGAKTRYLLRNLRDNSRASLSMARPGELTAVSIGSGSIWALPVLALLHRPLTSIPALAAAAVLLGSQAAFWWSMVRSGGTRGLGACLVSLLDLTLMMPAALTAAFSYLLLGRRY